ncbi:MAG: AraC family transcriptional regulator [Eubacteriales bacterium]|nr:AraC family transcriptional regulator [Eubacteriales bacterium]
MQKDQLFALKEHSHGTKTFPCAVYKTRAIQKGTMVKHHWHEEVEILYFYGGTFQLKINMEQFPITSECLYFINPGELHSIISKQSDNLEEDAVVFDPGLLSFESYDAAQMKLIQPIRNGKLLFPRCILPDHPAFVPVRDAFMEIMNSFSSGRKLYNECLADGVVTDDMINQLYIKSALLKILAILSSAQLFTSTEKNYDKRIEGIKAALTYIKENYKEKIYVRDLSNLLNMNEQYFCRFFKKAIGRSPMDYVNEYRIKQAAKLLEETDMSVTEICLECGFHNIGNFLREFKKYMDTTPLQYRKNFPAILEER